MHTTCPYELDGVVNVKGIVSIEFNYISAYVGDLATHDDDAEILRVTADSLVIVDAHGRTVFEPAIFTETQAARIGAEVLVHCEAEIAEACVRAGREQSTAEARGYSRADHDADQADMTHSDGERN